MAESTYQYIYREMVGHKLGEFAPTRPSVHAGSGGHRADRIDGG